MSFTGLLGDFWPMGAKDSWVYPYPMRQTRLVEGTLCFLAIAVLVHKRKYMS